VPEPDYSNNPLRLRPFLAQWDYMADQLRGRLEGLTDDEYLWQPTRTAWTVARRADGRTLPDQRAWEVGARDTPPRTLAWSVGHLGEGSLVRADYLVGGHSLTDEDIDWPMTAQEGLTFLDKGLNSWRDGLDQMTEQDLDTVGRSAFPGGLDLQLPLIEIVWWVNKELLEHTAEIWYVRDLYSAMRREGRA
jgi:hypothetical protein